MTTFETNQLSFFDDQLTRQLLYQLLFLLLRHCVGRCYGERSQLMTFVQVSEPYLAQRKDTPEYVARIQRFNAFGDHSQPR